MSILNSILDTLRNIGPVENCLMQLLSTNGDGTGTKNMNVNGSVTPVKFYVQPPLNTSYKLNRLNINATASSFIDATKYAGVTLTNGIKAYVERKGVKIKDFTRDINIKSSYMWGLLAGIDSITQEGALSDPLLVRWTFDRSYKKFILYGNKLDRFVIEIADNLTSMTTHYAMLQGEIL